LVEPEGSRIYGAHALVDCFQELGLGVIGLSIRATGSLSRKHIPCHRNPQNAEQYYGCTSILQSGSRAGGRIDYQRSLPRTGDETERLNSDLKLTLAADHLEQELRHTP